ncbi:tubulin-specific chaperone D-like [Ctenocephalides felis]|uniref:tubulin-specific chaperone D-like n=1 Tax=Ctenocephalides felis TaxID=7515 RepID=UPI000E6E3044|nr:tubulin-specific chaperone D-like [Ctenocephalides felis]
MNVTRIAIQGRAHSTEFVTEFAISYGHNGLDYADYKEPGGYTKVERDKGNRNRSFSKVFNDDAEFSTQILALSRSEIKGSKKIYKILASINVFCQLIQFESVRRKALIQISVLLGHSVMHVRKTTATKFYEALIIHSDCLDIPGDDLDEVMTYLSEGNWDGSVQEVRTMRNDVCKLLGVPPPITPGSSQNK